MSTTRLHEPTHREWHTAFNLRTAQERGYLALSLTKGSNTHVKAEDRALIRAYWAWCAAERRPYVIVKTHHPYSTVEIHWPDGWDDDHLAGYGPVGQFDDERVEAVVRHWYAQHRQYRFRRKASLLSSRNGFLAVGVPGYHSVQYAREVMGLLGLPGGVPLL